MPDITSWNLAREIGHQADEINAVLGGGGGSGVIIGTGSPEGVVDAPAGTLYVNEERTTGDYLWIKETSAPAAFWKCIAGNTSDSGLYYWDILQDIQADWFGTGIGIRRVGPRVELFSYSPAQGAVRLTKEASGAALALSGLPEPLRPTLGTVYPGVLMATTSADDRPFPAEFRISSNGDITLMTGIDEETKFHGTMGWYTERPWPAPEDMIAY